MVVGQCSAPACAGAAARWIEYGIGVGRIPPRAHTGGCPMSSGSGSGSGSGSRSRSRPATAQSVREVLLTVPNAVACPLCLPDSELGLLEC
ncbi:DUF6233 domain-containing protein [Streptomyces sp. NPDC096339]|uniref:DUF6233 domain-containing protein n=1 Tax=Streptomyces sp. NPDC096339 TaxID=3366086 RepID=UPI0038227749